MNTLKYSTCNITNGLDRYPNSCYNTEDIWVQRSWQRACFGTAFPDIRTPHAGPNTAKQSERASNTSKKHRFFSTLFLHFLQSQTRKYSKHALYIETSFMTSCPHSVLPERDRTCLSYPVFEPKYICIFSTKSKKIHTAIPLVQMQNDLVGVFDPRGISIVADANIQRAVFCISKGNDFFADISHGLCIGTIPQT